MGQAILFPHQELPLVWIQIPAECEIPDQACACEVVMLFFDRINEMTADKTFKSTYLLLTASLGKYLFANY